MKNQRGQALPLAVIALAIGALVVVPFISHAGTTLLDSGIYAQEINARAAADAGVEHAIWRLTDSNLQALIPNVGNQLTYYLPQALNGYTPAVTVTTTAVGGGGSGTAGTINKSILSSNIFDAAQGLTPDFIHVTGDIYAIAYSGSSNKGYVKTFSVASDGTITGPLNTLQIENASGNQQDIFYVSGNIYGVAYHGNANRGVVRTFSISSAGVISSSYISTLNFETNTCYTPSVTPVGGGVFAIAYQGRSNRGYLKTVSINSAGTISSVISTMTFDSSAAYEPEIIPVAGTYYAIAYRGASNHGYLKTVSISAAGVISGSAVSTLVYDAAGGYEPDILNVSGIYYAIAYRNASGQGALKTVYIASNGVISGTAVSSFIFDSATAYEPSIVNVINDTFALVYRTAAAQAYLITLSISSSGVITPALIDTFNFDATCYTPVIKPITTSIYGVVYQGAGSDGIFVTIGVSDGTTPQKTYQIISTAGNISISVTVQVKSSTAQIATWIVN